MTEIIITQMPTLEELFNGETSEEQAYQLWYQAVSWKLLENSEAQKDPTFRQMWLEEGRHSGYIK